MLSYRLKAQEAGKHDSGGIKINPESDSLFHKDREPSTSVYFELLGKFFYSFNIDFRPKENYAFGTGLQYLEDGIIPSIMYFRFYGERRRFETGGGLSGIFGINDGVQGMAIVFK
jgi:hypothetical protein